MWNNEYDGVYVEKQKETKSNVYLKKLGINPDIKTADGRILTLRNHAIMIKEISERSETDGGTSYRAVSLQPINPASAPDPFEANALNQFAKGALEVAIIENNKKSPVFRFAAPFRADGSCLECHAVKIGSLIGAVSLKIPITELVNHTQTTKLLIALTSFVILGLIIATSYGLIWRLVISLDIAQQHLIQLAQTDELTGLTNRRSILKRLKEEHERAARNHDPICVMIADVDFFKKINDSLGHPAGDYVLKSVTARMKAELRSYDIIGRIGGEEFVVVTPNTSLDDAVILADRLRKTIGSVPFIYQGTELLVTLSIGVAEMGASSGVEDAIKRADAALYRAKQCGRNRVEVDDEGESS